MPVKFNDHSANERRRNAEVTYRDILNRRLNELNAGADAVQVATLRVFPNLFAAPSPVETPVQKADVAPVAQVESVPEIIDQADQANDQVLSDQDKQLIAARLAIQEAHYETAA